MSGDSVASGLAVIAVWLGSICFPFSTLFFGHQQVAAFLVFAFGILFSLRRRHVSRTPRTTAALVMAAGFFVGFGTVSEYPSVLLGALLAAYFAFRLRHVDAAARIKIGTAGAFLSGVTLGLALLAIYNIAAFGRVVYTPYHALGTGGGSAMFQTHSRGVAGVNWPGLPQFLDVLAEITVRPQRGLLYLGVEGTRVFACSPVLWLAVPGLAFLAARRGLRMEAALSAAVIVVYITFNACYGNSIVFWGGGASVGPRHLIPMLPFAAIPLCFAVCRLKFLFYPLLMISIFYMLIATAVEPRTPYRPRNPWSGMYLPAYLEGRFATADDGLFEPGEKLTGNSTAFNFPKLAGVPGRWQLAPLMVVWLILGVALLRELECSGDRTRSPGSRLRLSTSMLAVYLALIALGPPLLGPSAESSRIGWRGHER